jgi:magnesium-transporting ATPase (P-type)
MAGERRTIMQIHAIEMQKAKAERMSEESTSRPTREVKKVNKRSFGDYLYYTTVLIAVITLISILIFAFQHGMMKIG